MAIIKCKECKKDVSTTAKTCPNCGAKVIKPTSITNIVLALVVLVLIVKCTMDKPPSTSSPATPAKATTAADIAAAAAEDKRFSAAIAFAKVIRANAKDPASVAFVQIGMNTDGTLGCATYRAKNSFNATVPGVAVLVNNTVYIDQSKWDKHCAKAAGLHNETSAGG